MFYCLKDPIEQLRELLEKVNKTHKDCHPYDYTECDYLDSKIEDKEKFKECIIEAIRKIEEADRFVKQ